MLCKMKRVKLNKCKCSKLLSYYMIFSSQISLLLLMGYLFVRDSLMKLP